MWDLGRLRLLRELQVRGTISQVAASLSFSPSTVSQQLAKLEREVGRPLLEPDGRRVRLTREGEIVAAHAARVMDLEEQTQAELDAGGPGRETVRVAALETVMRALLPGVVRTLGRTHPHIRVEASVVAPEEGLFELEARTFDLAIAEQYPGYTRPRPAGLDSVVIGSDPVHLAAGVDTAVTSIEAANGAAWVTEPAGTAVHGWIVQQCRAAGYEPDIRYESADLHVHMDLVRSGLAVSVLPHLTWAGDHRGVRLVDLPGRPRRELFASAREAATGRSALRAVREAFATSLARATDAAGAAEVADAADARIAGAAGLGNGTPRSELR
ncbi:MAG: LysR family transcriptional regulator [Pseudoclavibacter sp.]